MTSTESLKQLLALADKATLDFETSHPHPRPVRDTTRCVDCTCVEGGASAEAFIAACSPDTIRELVTELIDLRERVAVAETGCDRLLESSAETRKMGEALAAELLAAREEVESMKGHIEVIADTNACCIIRLEYKP